MAEVKTDAHHKMSKKIAQLTKVIFHLHTKNEENNQYIDALTRAYEKEMDNLINEANSTIQRQKDSIQALKHSADSTAKMSDLQEKHDKEKKESQKMFEELRVSIENKEKESLSEQDSKLQKIRDEINTLTSKYESKIKSLNDQVKQSEGKLEEQKRLFQKELADHVKEQNKKFNDLLQEKLSSEDRLKSGFEKEKKELIAMYEAKIKDAISKVSGEGKDKFTQMLESMVSF
jgi:serologically defined colon cancer antigen 8